MADRRKTWAGSLVQLGLAAMLIAVPRIADADTCWPRTVDPSIAGQLLHYDHSYAGGTKGRPIMHAAMGRSRHGGHVWCGFMGTPDTVQHMTKVWETDARGVKVVWRDPPEWLTLRSFGAEREASVYERACARGTGPCYVTERRGWTSRTTEYARSCVRQDGQDWYVTRSTGLRHFRTVEVDGVRVELEKAPTYSLATVRWQRFDAAGRTVEDLNYRWHDTERGLAPPEALPGERMYRLTGIGHIGDLPCLTGNGDCRDDLSERPSEGLNALYICRLYADRVVVADAPATGD